MSEALVKHEAKVTLEMYLDQRKEKLAEIVPNHLKVDRLLKVALNCVSKSEKLKQCSMSSVLQCVVTCAELGLEPGGALGGAYLVPRKDTCTLVIGYRGFVDLMRRSGALSTIRAVTVHAKDAFKYREGLDVELFHEPFINGDAGELKFVYCVLKFKDGGTQVTVMSKAQVEAVRRRSQASDGPWTTDYEEMAKKTVIRRAAKLAPMSAELVRAIEAEDDVVDGEVVSQASSVLESAESALQRKARRLVIEDIESVSSSGEPPADVKLPTV